MAVSGRCGCTAPASPRRCGSPRQGLGPERRRWRAPRRALLRPGGGRRRRGGGRRRRAGRSRRADWERCCRHRRPLRRARAGRRRRQWPGAAGCVAFRFDPWIRLVRVRTNRRAKRTRNARRPRQGAGHTSGVSVLYHPDYTVGSGIQPDLLTPSRRPDGFGNGRSRADAQGANTAGGEFHPALRTFATGTAGRVGNIGSPASWHKGQFRRRSVVSPRLFGHFEAAGASVWK